MHEIYLNIPELTNFVLQKKFVKNEVRVKCALMIAQEWLKIVNLVGYLVKPTKYMVKTFPSFSEQLSSRTWQLNSPNQPITTNLVVLAEIIGDVVFNSKTFKLEDDCLEKWAASGNKSIKKKGVVSSDSSYHQGRIWEDENTWLLFKMTTTSGGFPVGYVLNADKTPFYWTLSNIVEQIFLGKMFRNGHYELPPKVQDNDQFAFGKKMLEWNSNYEKNVLEYEPIKMIDSKNAPAPLSYESFAREKMHATTRAYLLTGNLGGKKKPFLTISLYPTIKKPTLITKRKQNLRNVWNF